MRYFVFPPNRCAAHVALDSRSKRFTMKIQFAATLKDRHGEDITEPDRKDKSKERAITLSDVCCAVLDAVFEDEARGQDPKEKARKWKLMLAITEAEKSLSPLDLPSEDIALLKARLGKSAYPATVSGGAMEMLERGIEPAE
jgi:hypothetical protein